MRSPTDMQTPDLQILTPEAEVWGDHVESILTQLAKAILTANTREAERLTWYQTTHPSFAVWCPKYGPGNMFSISHEYLQTTYITISFY